MEKVKEQLENQLLKQKENKLILFNDDFNTFDFVIETLIELCNHDMLQAEQCALTVHNNGKCDVKSGSKKQLLPIKNEMQNRGLTVEVL